MNPERKALRDDEPSGTLDVDACAPGVLVRRNPRTGAVENVEILDFNRRAAKGRPLPLALAASMHLAA